MINHIIIYHMYIYNIIYIYISNIINISNYHKHLRILLLLQYHEYHKSFHSCSVYIKQSCHFAVYCAVHACQFLSPKSHIASHCISNKWSANKALIGCTGCLATIPCQIEPACVVRNAQGQVIRAAYLSMDNLR